VPDDRAPKDKPGDKSATERPGLSAEEFRRHAHDFVD